MWGYNNYANTALTNELISDLWIQQNIPGGLNSKLFQNLIKTLILINRICFLTFRSSW